MGPAGFMSIYQPVDLMDITVGMPAWQALSPRMQAFLEDEVRVYSLHHHAQIEAADQLAWKEFDAAGVEVSRLSAAHVVPFPNPAVPKPKTADTGPGSSGSVNSGRTLLIY